MFGHHTSIKAQEKVQEQEKEKVQDQIPFYPPTPNFPSWDLDLAYTASDYILLDSSKGKETVKDPLKDVTKPIAFFTPQVLKETQYIAEYMAAKKSEAAWMYLTTPLNPDDPRVILVHTLILCAQDATGAHVSMDMEDWARYTDYLKENYPEQCGKNLALNTAHGHLHPNMGVFNSGTDTEQQESKTQLGFQASHRFFFVFNNMKQVKATMVLYRPVFHRVEDVPVGIYTGTGVSQGAITKARKAELDKQMDTLIKKTPLYTPVYPKLNGYHHTNWYPNKGVWEDDKWEDRFSRNIADRKINFAEAAKRIAEINAPIEPTAPIIPSHAIGEEVGNMVMTELEDFVDSVRIDEDKVEDMALIFTEELEKDEYPALKASLGKLKGLGFFSEGKTTNDLISLLAAVCCMNTDEYGEPPIAGTLDVLLDTTVSNSMDLVTLLFDLDNLGVLGNILAYCEDDGVALSSVLFYEGGAFTTGLISYLLPDIDQSVTM